MKNYTIITGGHTGIGLGLTKKLLTAENKLGLILRNEERKEEFLSAIGTEGSNLLKNIDFFFADLSDQEEVRAVGRQIATEWERVDRLFNNAGIAIMTRERKTSKQGNELHLEINTLAPLLLTEELKPLLINAPNSRVVTTVTERLQKSKLATTKIFNENYTSGMQLYLQSKLATLQVMNDLAKQDSWHKVKFICVHPGNNKTNMTQSKEHMPRFIRFMVRLFFKDASFGAERLYNAGFELEFAGKSGIYLQNDKIISPKYELSQEDKHAIMAAVQKVDS